VCPAHTRIEQRERLPKAGAVVGETGFEPAISSSQMRRITKLSYTPVSSRDIPGEEAQQHYLRRNIAIEAVVEQLCGTC
jgi:hypothetical protein